MLTSLFRRRSATEARPGPRHFIVAPAGRGPVAPCGAARHLLAAARLRAEHCARAPVGVLAVEAGTGRARPLDVELTDAPPAAAHSPRDWHGSEPLVLMNAAFLLADTPPLGALVARAELLGWALSGVRGTRDTHAFAFVPARTPPAFVAAALRHLVACLGDDVEALWRTVAAEPLVPPAPALDDNSPALGGVSGAWSRRLPESPRYLNTALRELVDDPARREPIDADPARLARALLAQRERSRVPWVFNTLLNEVEYRLGTPAPSSFPPELRLSLGGACGPACHCRADGRGAPGDVERLDFLRHARVLRLDGSPDEPALGRHLSAIAAATCERHPHLGTDLLTSGVGLHEPGVVPALVGRARRVSVPLDAATRETWRALHGGDLFDQVCHNVRALARAKRERRALIPLLQATLALRRANLAELPRLPALCRELGIDRLTALPLEGFALDGRGRSDALEACREEYDAVYDETVREAERRHVSLAIPAPSARPRGACDPQARPRFDFARIESDEWPLGRLLGTLRFEREPGAHCAFLWRQAAVGQTRRAGATQAGTRFLHPCLGPLRHADLSAHLLFRFPAAAGFVELWRQPLLQRLRRAQAEPGVSPVCDACRASGPRESARSSALVAEFETELHGAPLAAR
jgi:MoaA/NifB/PqqE/SkfB family radical SAM enzyme